MGGGWRPSAKKTAQPHLTARLPQVDPKPPRQRHLAAQEKKNAAKTKAPERRSKTRDTSKPIARVSAGSCNFKPESRENAMRQCLQRPSQNGDKTNKKRPPNQVTQGHLAQGGGKQPGNCAPPRVQSTQGSLGQWGWTASWHGQESLPQQAEATNGLPTRL